MFGHVFENALAQIYPLIANFEMLSLFAWTEILFGGVIAKPSKGHARECGSHNYLFGVVTTLLMFRPVEFVFGTLLDTRGEPIMTLRRALSARPTQQSTAQ